jgi:hypothetical protein
MRSGKRSGWWIVLPSGLPNFLALREINLDYGTVSPAAKPPPWCASFGEFAVAERVLRRALGALNPKTCAIEICAIPERTSAVSRASRVDTTK